MGRQTQNSRILFSLFFQS